jgi:hypothetical protein
MWESPMDSVKVNVKVNLLFDGRIIVEFLRDKKTYPSGLFFVSLNLLKAFLNDTRFNENLRKDYIKKGIERAKLFTWKKTVDKMSEVIISRLD